MNFRFNSFQPGSFAALHFRLFVGDTKNFYFRFTAHRFAVETPGLEAGFDFLARGVVSPVYPSVDAKRPFRNEYVSRADNRATGIVDDFRRDRVTLALAGEHFPCQRCVDFHVDRAGFADGHRIFRNDFRLASMYREPRRGRPRNTPVSPAGQPGRVVSEPAVTGTVEPIPGPPREPRFIGRLSHDFVCHGRFGDGAAEVVFRFNRCVNFFAQFDGFLRSVDGYLVLWLLVLFDAERAAAKMAAVCKGHDTSLGDIDTVHAQRGVFRQFQICNEAAV